MLPPRQCVSENVLIRLALSCHFWEEKMGYVERFPVKEKKFSEDFGCGWSIMPLLIRLSARVAEDVAQELPVVDDQGVKRAHAT